MEKKKNLSRTKKIIRKVKESAQKSKKKINEVRKTSTWKKVKRGVKKVARITGSHLATLRTSITLSNKESELMSELENRLEKINAYASKSQILRAGLWSLRKMSDRQLEKAVKDLLGVKRTRIL